MNATTNSITDKTLYTEYLGKLVPMSTLNNAYLIMLVTSDYSKSMYNIQTDHCTILSIFYLLKLNIKIQ